MEAALQEYVRHSLHCADWRSGAVVPRPLVALQHGAVVEGFHFDYLHLGVAEGDEFFAAEAGYEYLLVLVEDIRGFV